jgi:hypothetical protein
MCRLAPAGGALLSLDDFGSSVGRRTSGIRSESERDGWSVSACLVDYVCDRQIE